LAFHLPSGPYEALRSTDGTNATSKAVTVGKNAPNVRLMPTK
jgi:hypothetical protein